MQKLTRDEMAQRVARDIPEGAYVNLGIGLPTRIANYLPADKEVFLHSENGLLGMGPKPQPGEEDPELINAGKEYVTLLQGLLFPPRRLLRHDARRPSRYLRAGAYQVSASGDLANWSTGAPDAIPAVGGAMDLAIGARQVFVMMDHLTRDGECKLVAQCSYPLTGVGCVSRIYTDLAVIDITDRGPVVREIFNGLSFEELQRITPVALTFQQLAESA
ncbi:3-oxoadipate CoA-transferase [Klebsiella pneumoniae]|nr:3-oxoadipate CoA-transferase [Klebsiella pneumoniae]